MLSASVRADRAAGLLANMRIRKKLILLHTFFSLVLAAILLAAMWPAINRVVEAAELHGARAVISAARMRFVAESLKLGGGEIAAERVRAVVQAVAKELGPGVEADALPMEAGAPALLLGGLEGVSLSQGGGLARRATPVRTMWSDSPVVLTLGPSNTVIAAVATLEDARGAVVRLYIFMVCALLGVYALIAVFLEIFVLPRHVYGPIREMLRADAAALDGEREREIIPAARIPADELGEIMSSRNRTVLSLRRHEEDLARALEQLATAAADLKKKNHLLEAAQRNLADADRLVSLGMMSAGLAHELNTPLAVIKGLVEEVAASPSRRFAPEEAALLLRVVGRLERLSESLLDFARVRPPRTAPVQLAKIVDEAWTLVRLDRDNRRASVELVLAITPPELVVECDADRLVQVLVNILRNAADAMESRVPQGAPDKRAENGLQVGLGTAEFGSATEAGVITVSAGNALREEREWVTITISDNGPGIDPEILGRLFEPFASTKLDSKGTGLGLAVSEGIVREHGGVLLARNASTGRGAVFEITIPSQQDANAASSDA